MWLHVYACMYIAQAIHVVQSHQYVFMYIHHVFSVRSALALHLSLPLPDIHKTLSVSPPYISIQQIGTISEMLQ